MITISDPTQNTVVQNIFKQNSSIKVGVGCDIEYNMNSLIDGITVSSATADSSYTNAIANWPSNKGNPYKKLFPIDSVILPFRPAGSGIKYYVLTASNTDTTSGMLSPYRIVTYPNDKPRIYYPGVTTSYKYWLSALNTNADITITYKQSSSQYTGNKNALANKIVIKFEKYHAIPSNYTVTITKSDNSTTTIGPSSPPSNGVINLYYTGSSWTTSDNSKTVGSVSPILIKSIRVQATNPGGGKFIGIIEVSARWVKDISNDIETISISKESSSSDADILPVGTVTANNIVLNISRFNESELKIVSYNRDSTSFNSDLIYVSKNVELRPYFKVFNSTGLYGSSPNKYDRIEQGSYFINNISISEYGQAEINALDGAKILMETFCPDILCESYPVTAVLRRLLDSIGFSNYNFNLETNDTSVPFINFWWTEEQKTIWETIQELCRDIQMNAVFDENNILQFYSRDYMYKSSRSAVWNFYQEKEGSTLPNIIDFNQTQIPGANYVKVIWTTPISSDYVGKSQILWDVPQVYLGAGGLKEDINNSSQYIVLDTEQFGETITDQTFYSFQGYMLIDSEIIEYDAIEYDYTPIESSIRQKAWLESPADVNKYLNISKSGFEDINNPETAYFKPSGKYRIKTRGALGTTKVDHTTLNTKVQGWNGYNVPWST